MRPKRRPTRRTIARRVSDLLAALAAVYADEGRYTVQKTTPLGTIFVTWRSGAAVLADKDAEPIKGACEEP
jgi:hypothetical protein